MRKEITLSSTIYLVLFFLMLLLPQRHVNSSIVHIDVLAHVIGIFLLYFILYKGFRLRKFLSITVVLIISGLTEVVQHFIPWRDCSLSDLFADFIGAFLALLMSYKRGLIENIIATFGYVGYFRIAPGTIASFIVTLLIYWIKPSLLLIVESLALILFSGIIASSLFAMNVNEEDPGEIVIDEVVGVLVAFLFLPEINVMSLLFAFVFFRLYDIIKPLGIRKVEKIGGGSGIILDDVLAGIYAGASTFLILLMFKKGGIL